jgi:hypothetical protein
MSGTLGRKRRVARLSRTLAYRVAIWLRHASPTVISRVTMFDGDGEKYNPRAPQFCPNVHTTAVRVTAIAAPFAAETATASLLLRRRQDNPAHATLAAGGVHLCVNEAKSVATLKMLAQNCPAEICDQSDSGLA